LLVTAEFLIGIAAVASGLPIGLAVAHNWVAGLLLLVMLRISVLNWNERRAASRLNK